MRIEPLGDSAALLRDLTEPAYQLVPTLEKLPGVLEAAASYDTVGVYFEPGAEAMRDLQGWLDAISSSEQGEQSPGRGSLGHLIPVCYELGEDLAEVAAELSLMPEAVIDSHLSPEYQCFAVGFMPGFPYLGYLPPEISGVRRRGSPRISVPAGSVAITGRQTGVYPSPSPGGWNLIGRTPLIIVDIEDGYFPISAGDAVQFRRIDEHEFAQLKGERL